MRCFIASFVFAVALISQALALTPGQRLLLLNTCPAQVKVGGVCPSAGMNFQTGTYYVQGQGVAPFASLVSVTRASSHLCQQSNGTWISVGNNTACITNQGFLIEEARTNKCTNYNANPTDLTNVTKSGDAAATLTVVDDTAALLAAGLQNIATSGKVYKLDNSAGVAVSQFNATGLTANTNNHVSSVYARGSGLSTVGMTTVGSLGTPSTPLTNSYVRYSSNAFSGSAIRQFYFVIAAGATAYIILNQLEEGAFVTSPIVIAGASATRAADVPQLIGPAATAALNAKSAFFQTYGVAGGTAPRLLNIGSTKQLLWLSSTSAQISTGAASPAVATVGSGTYAGLQRIAGSFDSSGIRIVVSNGSPASSADAWEASGAAILGNLADGSRALNGYMQRFALSPVKGIFDQSTQLPYLLKRDVIPGTPANDNTPMYLNEAA